MLFLCLLPLDTTEVILLPVSPDCREDKDTVLTGTEGSFGLGNSSPLPVRLAQDLFCVLALLAALPCHVCESARVGPAMQVINADDVGGLFQRLSLSRLAGGWYM